MFSGFKKKRTDCRAPYGGLACRLGRCFCFAEVSTGHPHRNDSFFDTLKSRYNIGSYFKINIVKKITKISE